MEDILYKIIDYITIGASLHDEYGNFLLTNSIFCNIFNTNNDIVKLKKFNTNLFKVNIENFESTINWININYKNINNKIIKIINNDNVKWIKLNTIKLKNGYEYYLITYEDVSDSINYSLLYEEIFNNINTGIMIIYTEDGNTFSLKNINQYGLNTCSLNEDDINKSIEELNLPILNDNTILSYIKTIWKNEEPINLKFAKCKKININDEQWRNVSFYKTKTNQIIILFHNVTDIVNYKNIINQYDKMKSTFLSNVSHELRSPINAIIGFIDILENSNNQEEINECVKIIKNSSKSIIKLIDDISDMSKIQEGKISINKNIFNINSIIKDIYDISLIKLKDNVELTCDINFNKDLLIKSDPDRFKQIFVNLIDNSIKFTKKGYIKIGYYIENNFIIFYVEDSGLGVKEEDRNMVFNRFHKIDKTSKIGTGLGLTISKQLVNLLGGDIWFKSKFNSGSTFYFKLPYNEKQKKLIFNRKIKKDKKINIHNIDLTNKKILLVEDVEFNIKLILSYLESTNVTIIKAETGNDALLMYNEHKNDLDLILMDIQLPEIDGNEVTQIIRSIDDNIPIIAQTAYAMKEDTEDIMQYGFNDLIKKPIMRDELLKMIMKYI